MVHVHKAVEPDNLSVRGKKRMADLVTALIQGHEEAALLPKYDGVYAQFLLGNYGWEAYSRTGQRLLSVSGEVLDVFDRMALETHAYIGELWLPGENHQTINGLARKQSPQRLELKLFDAYEKNPVEVEGGDPMSYLNRRDYLFARGPVTVAPLLPTKGKINVLDDVYDLAQTIKNRTSAYDGLILRDMEAGFYPGRGIDGEIIKIKPRAEGDFRVVGVTPGIGNRAGGYGALVLDLGGGVLSEVGTGLTMSDVFEEESPVGRIATIEYLGVTKGGKLREPSFKGYRFDKTETDVLDFTKQTED